MELSMNVNSKMRPHSQFPMHAGKEGLKYRCRGEECEKIRLRYGDGKEE